MGFGGSASTLEGEMSFNGIGLIFIFKHYQGTILRDQKNIDIYTDVY